MDAQNSFDLLREIRALNNHLQQINNNLTSIDQSLRELKNSQKRFL